MTPQMVLGLLRGLVPALGGARDPHAPARALRSLRSGDPRHEPARDAPGPFALNRGGDVTERVGARDPHAPARALRSLRSGDPGGPVRVSRLLRPVMLAVLLLALLAGCGFQLRGQASLPAAMSTTWLSVPDPTSAFARELALLLRGNGVVLVDGPAEDAAELRILQERITRRALTISGDARVREFELVFDLRFSLVASDGEVLLPPELLRLERDFQFDEQEILGAATEEELLRENLRRNMAAALIRRLEAFGRS